MMNNFNQFHRKRDIKDECFHGMSYPQQEASMDVYSDDGGSTRGRLDSGSLSNSSSENLDGNKKRRSHRPRGCRGGGSRRQRKALREQVREREMMEALQENVEPRGYSHLSGLNANSSEYTFPPKFVSSISNNYNPERQDGVSKEISLYGDAVTPMLQPSMSNLSTNSSSSCPPNNDPLFSIFTPQLSSNQYMDSHGHLRSRVPYGRMTFFDSQAKYMHGFANENINGSLGNQLHFEQQAPSNIQQPMNTHQGLIHSKENNGGAVSVLPPLQINIAKTEPEKLHGPNPYALKSNRLTFQSELTEALEADGADYRFDRIEKQCQMLAGGGSLFVTSPRSFLMGRKNSV